MAHVGVEVETIDAVDLEGYMAVEHVVDVHHAGHRHIVAPEGRLCRSDNLNPVTVASGGGWEG
ncbi:MAG TPA: hypothetical protein VNG12_12770, partial [Acidimicrobiales bacterium]|nr:hypothetical protein [Acidimicrobiales bacterium]